MEPDTAKMATTRSLPTSFTTALQKPIDDVDISYSLWAVQKCDPLEVAFHIDEHHYSNQLKEL